ncbi:MAG: ABC transporter ATP-binding protein [Promethearchaeota archaeon]
MFVGSKIFPGDPVREPVLSVRDLVKVYDLGEVKVKALNGVTLDVMRGEFVSIMGTSGSGKTTLLNLIGGLDSVTDGQIWIEGKNIAEMNDHELTTIRRHRMGFIFQVYNLLPVLNAFENVELPLKINGVSSKERKRRVEEALELVGLSDRAKNKPSQLSGGQQQRVAIARALVLDPAIILADEPTGALDSATGSEIITLLTRLNDEAGRTIVMVTHDRNIASYSQKIFHMSDGQIVNVEQL